MTPQDWGILGAALCVFALIVAVCVFSATYGMTLGGM